MKRFIVFIMASFIVLFAFTGYIIYKDQSSKVVFKSDGKSEYATLRSTVETALIKKGPSPQEYRELKALDNAEEITYRSGDNELKAWISTNVNKNKKNPAVVYIHGDFAFSEDNWNQAKEFVNAGFVVMTPMLRGENGNPGDFEFLYGEVDDIIAAGKYLAGLPYVDKKNIFLAGHSVGGAGCILTSMMPSPYKAVASFGGAPLDLRVDLKANPKLAEMLPFDPGNEKELSIRLPVNYAQSIITPLFMFVESNSHLAGIKEQTAAFVEAANRDSKKADYCVVQGDHLSALREEISLCADLFFKQLKEKKVVFIPLKPAKSQAAEVIDNRDLPKLRAETIKNWSRSEEATQIIQGITDENEKRAFEIAERLRKEGMIYWDGELVKELSTKELYEKKLTFIKTFACCEPTMTVLKVVTKKIKITNDKDTITVYYEDAYDYTDTNNGPTVRKVQIYYTITIDTATWRICDLVFNAKS